MFVPSANGRPHHNPSRDFSCCVQGPDKGHFLPRRPGCFWHRKKMTAADLAVWWSMSSSPISLGHEGELPSAVFISHSWRGESKTRWGCVLCRWVLLINIRNSTRGYEALNWSVISYMGFAKCLCLDNKHETSGPASAEELPYESRNPLMLGAAVQARGLFRAWHKAVSRCAQRLGSCPLPQDAKSADISLLPTAAILIFMHTNTREYLNTSCAQSSRALPRAGTGTGFHLPLQAMEI